MYFTNNTICSFHKKKLTVDKNRWNTNERTTGKIPIASHRNLSTPVCIHPTVTCLDGEIRMYIIIRIYIIIYIICIYIYTHNIPQNRRSIPFHHKSICMYTNLLGPLNRYIYIYICARHDYIYIHMFFTFLGFRRIYSTFFYPTQS